MHSVLGRSLHNSREASPIDGGIDAGATPVQKVAVDPRDTSRLRCDCFNLRPDLHHPRTADLTQPSHGDPVCPFQESRGASRASRLDREWASRFR